MKRRVLSVVELVGIGAVSFGAGVLSVGWGFIVGGVLVIGWAALESLDVK